MTIDELRELFTDPGVACEFLKHDRIETKLHPRPDLHAFLLLDRLVPGKNDMISVAEHDKIWLDTDCGLLAAVATESQVVDLSRCGVKYDDDHVGLCMFV